MNATWVRSLLLLTTRLGGAAARAGAASGALLRFELLEPSLADLLYISIFSAQTELFPVECAPGLVLHHP